jgi:hypothetical protein
VPAGSKSAVGFSAAGQTMVDTTGATSLTETIRAANAAGNELLPAMMQLDPDASQSIAVSSAGSLDIAGSVGFIPDTVGEYVVTVWHDQNLDGAIGADEDKNTKTFTVSDVSTTLTVTKPVGSTFAAGTSLAGGLVKLSLSNAAGVSGLSAGETIVVTPPSTGYVSEVNGTDTSALVGAAVTLTGANFISGVAWLNIEGAAGDDQVWTFAGAGSTAISAITGTFTASFKTIDAEAAAGTGTTVITGATATAVATFGTDGIAGSSTSATIPVAAKTIAYYTSGTTGFTTGDYAVATITDSSGRVTGSASQVITGLEYSLAYKLTETTVAGTTIAGGFSVAFSPTANSAAFSVATTAGDDLASTVTATTTVTAGTPTVSPSATTPLSLKNGGSATYTVTQKDQFGRVIPNATITMTSGTNTAGNKNAIVTALTASTDANGLATFTVTDAQSASAIAAGRTSDVFTFTGPGAAADGGKITWSATGPVVGPTGVTVTTGTEDDTTTSITYRDINAGATGTQAGAATITATVKDAAGNLLSGVPVTFSTTSAGAAVTSTTVTRYTSAAGVATASVYGWTAGTKTFTATAGGVSGTGTVNYKQQTATDVRTISAVLTGSIVAVTAKDRFGNTVEGVKIYATKTSGTGYFGVGSSTTNGTTDKNGLVEFVVAGTATFKFAAGDATAADVEYGQTSSKAGFVCAGAACTSTAVTAAVAGTTLVNEKGVGDTLAPAGVNSVEVSATADTTAADNAQAATDAAAEATDAANAATDAANAAAEAADAATAAAQDAADAVAALSTQVSEMVNALKKQITALTNLVIKIQKKVKA